MSDLILEASYAKVTQATAIKCNPLLLFSHTIGLNTTFCYAIVVTGVVEWLLHAPCYHRNRVRFALGLLMPGMDIFGV